MSSRGDAYRLAPAEPKKRLRVYQQWQGNETFFCWGYLVAGPNWRASLGTAFLLLAPTGIFLAFVAPYVSFKTNIVILVFSCILPAACALFLFLTACRDPGIIPRQEPDEEYLAGRKPRTQEVNVNGHRVIIRYNDTCHFYQPPRAHHCSVNDNCIERFDHHCPWVGTTIGKRNYRTFLLFVYSATVLCLYVMGVCLAQLFLKHQQYVDDDQAAGGDGSGQWGPALRAVIPALVLLGYCFMFLWFVGGLSGFHCYLSATNQTTYENFRYNHDNRPNPFNRGILANCAEVWCTSIPPSKVNFRAFVDELKGPKPPSLEMAAPVHQQATAYDPAGVGGMQAGQTTSVYDTPLYAAGLQPQPAVAQAQHYQQWQPPTLQQQQQQRAGQGMEQNHVPAVSSFAVQQAGVGSQPLTWADAYRAQQGIPPSMQADGAGGSEAGAGAGVGANNTWTRSAWNPAARSVGAVNGAGQHDGAGPVG